MLVKKELSLSPRVKLNQDTLHFQVIIAVVITSLCDATFVRLNSNIVLPSGFADLWVITRSLFESGDSGVGLDEFSGPS